VSVSLRMAWLLLPEARAGQEAVFNAGAGHIFQVGVRQRICNGGSYIFMCQVDSRYALIVR
jgi:hypothetical protein